MMRSSLALRCLICASIIGVMLGQCDAWSFSFLLSIMCSIVSVNSLIAFSTGAGALGGSQSDRKYNLLFGLALSSAPFLKWLLSQISRENWSKSGISSLPGGQEFKQKFKLSPRIFWS